MVPLFELTNLAMIYLVGTLVVAIRGHRGPAAFSSVLSVLCFDFFFVPPRFTLSVADTQYLLTFAVMFAAAMTISHLTIRFREKALAAEESEQRSVWLLEKAKKAEIEMETEQLRSSLLSSVSHDLRTPLAAILGSASTLAQNPLIAGDASSRELLENIQEESERLSRLVQNLLETTRLESGEMRLQKEPYALEEVIGSALARLEKTLAGQNVQVDLPEDLPLVAMDPILMEQVVLNLLENAARHASSQNSIAISAKVADDHILVAVADRGYGLNKEDLQNVFGKFYKGAASKGAGLGLAICRAVVLAHGGRIWAENREGGGAVFYFTLPLA